MKLQIIAKILSDAGLEEFETLTMISDAEYCFVTKNKRSGFLNTETKEVTIHSKYKKQ